MSKVLEIVKITDFMHCRYVIQAAMRVVGVRPMTPGGGWRQRAPAPPLFCKLESFF